MPNYLNITSANAFVDATSAALAAGTLEIEATDGADNPIPFRAGGNQQAMRLRIQRTITNGSIDGALQLANPALTSPINVVYRFTITDSNTGQVSVIPKVLIADDGQGNWYIGALNTGLSLSGVPFISLKGEPGQPGKDGVDGNILLGSGAAPASTSDYAKANPQNLASQSALNPGITTYANPAAAYGMDTGSGQGLAFKQRVFAPHGSGVVLAVHTSANAPTQQTDFNDLFQVTPDVAKLWPDANGNNPVFLFDRVTGDLTSTGKAVFAKLAIAAAAMVDNRGYFTVNPNQYNGGDGLTAGISFFNLNNGGFSLFGVDMATNGAVGNGVRRYAPIDGGCLVDALYDLSKGAPTGHASFLIHPSRANADGIIYYGVDDGHGHFTGPANLDKNGNFSTTGTITGALVTGQLKQAAGTEFQTSDGVSGIGATSLVQVRSAVLARRERPGSYVPSYAAHTYRSFGDSITAGVASSSPATSYTHLINTALGCAAFDNRGVGGDEVADTSLRMLGWENTTAANKRLYTLQIGTNDANLQGLGQHETDFVRTIPAVIAWLATRAEDRVDAGTVSAANWANCTDYAAIVGKTSTTVGASITYNVATHGQPLYLWSRYTDGNTGAFSVSVDGGAALAVSCASTVALATPNQQSGLGFAAPAANCSAIQLTRIAVPAGAHTVTITVTAAGNVTIFSVGTVSQHVYYTSPAVVVGGVLPQGGDRYQAVTAAYTMHVLDAVEMLQADGNDVRYADNRAAMQGGNLALYGQQGYGELHPNDAGHLADSLAFLDAIRRGPSKAVLRGTPLSSAGPGTPGDSWASNGYVYGVQADGSIQRAATASW